MNNQENINYLKKEIDQLRKDIKILLNYSQAVYIPNIPQVVQWACDKELDAKAEHLNYLKDLLKKYEG